LPVEAKERELQFILLIWALVLERPGPKYGAHTGTSLSISGGKRGILLKNTEVSTLAYLNATNSFQKPLLGV
jgi:hypothetical protein